MSSPPFTTVSKANGLLPCQALVRQPRAAIPDFQTPADTSPAPNATIFYGECPFQTENTLTRYLVKRRSKGRICAGVRVRQKPEISGEKHNFARKTPGNPGLRPHIGANMIR
jgi:hypothetical protein